MYVKVDTDYSYFGLALDNTRGCSFFSCLKIQKIYTIHHKKRITNKQKKIIDTSVEVSLQVQ